MTKKHEPTPELRAVVERCCAAGFRQEEIALVVGCSDGTLRKAYREELDRGTVRINAKVTERLYDIALGGDTRSALSACIFLAKTCLPNTSNKTALFALKHLIY
jgi:hypothetical protein